VLGVAAGIVLSVAQRVAIQAPLDVARSLAFALAFPITLLCIRWLAENAPVVVSILVSTTVVTLPIVAIHQSSKKIKTSGDR
jgi:predicted Co/Zn/Cd cation transporter (cation efflux family)